MTNEAKYYKEGLQDGCIQSYEFIQKLISEGKDINFIEDFIQISLKDRRLENEKNSN